jgi:hypothetical protein
MLKDRISLCRRLVASLTCMIVGTLPACSGQGKSSQSISSGASCQRNADCVSSPEAANHRAQCLQDIYCLSGACHWECRSMCQPQRTDVNPCSNSAFCAPNKDSVDKSVQWCTLTPVECNTVSDCPSYLPPIEAGSAGAWTCDSGICAYPNLQYSTY